MGNVAKVVIVGALVVAVAVVIAFKRKSVPPPAPTPASPQVVAAAGPAPTQGLPRLLDLGAKKCIPCKMMAPILAELKVQYAGRLQVDVIDVWENPRAAEEHGVRMIPTQIFFDAEGKELFRHVGFLSREDILATWKKLGLDLSASSP